MDFQRKLISIGNEYNKTEYGKYLLQIADEVEI
jgi:hypothetical protein